MESILKVEYVYKIGRCVVIVEAMTKDEADKVIREEYNNKSVVYVGQSDNQGNRRCGGHPDNSVEELFGGV